jgi:hypothetical protein
MTENEMAAFESTLPGLSGILATVDKLLKAGVSTVTLAETVAKFVDPTLVPALVALIKILQTAETMVEKV